MKANPSPLGQRILASLKADKAVILVNIPADLAGQPQLRAWLFECSDYCQRLATVIPVDPRDKQQAALLRYLAIDRLRPPALASIALSGAVKTRLSGKLSRKSVVDLFAAVTGSCGAPCDDVCP